MVLYANITIGSPSVTLPIGSFEYVRVSKSLRHESDSFEAYCYNVAGRNSGLFVLGSEVKIYHDIGSPANNQIFLGRIEILEYDSTPNRERIRIGGRDYTSYLMDNKVQNVYISGSGIVPEIGSVVRDVIWTSDFSGIITVNNVSGTTKTLANFKTKNQSVYEVVQQLAEIATYNFWVDYNKDLNFAPENNPNTGYVLNNTNVSQATFTRNSQEMFNKITVYGDRQLVDLRETFTADGVGSVFTLQANPFSPFVTDGGTPKAGTVYQLTNFLPTGAHYAVWFDRKQIIFLSGTSVGNNVPGSLSSVVVQYSKSVPIVKEASDDSSINAYGLKQNVITNLEITDPNLARDIALAELNISKNPALDGNLSILSTLISGIQPGQMIGINLPNDNVSGAQFKVIETRYDITKDNLLSNNTIQVRVGDRIKNVSDILQGVIQNVRQLQAQDADPNDTISRVKSATGSYGVRIFSWELKTRTVTTGSSFIIGNTTYGDLGSGTVQANPQTYLGALAYGLSLVQSGGGYQ